VGVTYAVADIRNAIEQLTPFDIAIRHDDIPELAPIANPSMAVWLRIRLLLHMTPIVINWEKTACCAGHSR
jgi:hypothetical protein